MRFGTALKLTRAGFQVRRSCWKDEPDSMHESGIGPALVWNDGGLILEWADIGFDDNRLSYTDLDSDDWELTERVDFGTALHLMHLGFYMRRRYWVGYAAMGIEIIEGDAVFRSEHLVVGSSVFHPIAAGLHDANLPGLTREDRFATDWGIASDCTPRSAVIQDIVAGFSPTNDRCWVTDGPDLGKPNLQEIERFCNCKITREQVEKAVPGWTLSKARDAIPFPLGRL